MSDAGIEEILNSSMPVIPDYAQLGGRLFVTDGRHDNKVVVDEEGNQRAMGAREQSLPLDVAFAEEAEGPLSRGGKVTYALRRVVRSSGLEIQGGLNVEYFQIPAGEEYQVDKGKCSVKIYPYEHELGVSEVFYQLFRSKPGNTLLLYLAASLDAEYVKGLEDNTYVDETADSSLDESVTVNLDSDGMELSIPPCRYVRAWNGALIMGGSMRRTFRASGSASSSSLSVQDGEVTVDDIGAYLSIPGELRTFQIRKVSGGTVTLNEPLEFPLGDEDVELWRDDDAVYVSRPLPGNIEVYSAESGRVITNSGDGNSITGIAVNGSYGYVFRRDKVEILAGTPETPSLSPFPLPSPPGCRSHATIADKYVPYIIYYAGRGGVWQIAGSEAKCLSLRIENLIVNGIDHSQDRYCHAVYDPGSRFYYLFVFSLRWRESGVRMPDMLLMYDTVSDAWTRGEMYATSSGLWRNSSGELVPVIGFPGGVARIGTGSADGGGVVSGFIREVGTDWFELEESAEAVKPGMPVHIGEGHSAQRRMVRSFIDGIVSIWGAMPEGVQPGDKAVFGAIRWHVTTPEIGLSGYFDRAMRLESLSLAHGRSVVPVNAEVVVEGIGNLSDEPSDSQEWKGTVDLSRRTVSRIDGRATGLRAASVQMSVFGDRGPALLKGIRIEMEKIQR